MFFPVAFQGRNTKCNGNISVYLQLLSQFSSTLFSSQTAHLFHIRSIQIILPHLIMPLQENYGHDDCKHCHSLELALPAVSQVRVTISRNKLVKPWKELQNLVSLKTSQRKLSQAVTVGSICANTHQKQWRSDEVHLCDGSKVHTLVPAGLEGLHPLCHQL